MSIKKYIGDRAFYKRVLKVSVPMMIQTGITNFVSLLDNIMVGTLQTEAMSGVSIVNQFIFILNLLIFGAVSAAGIFTAQYHGLDDVQGEKYTFRFKFAVNLAVALLGIVLFAATGNKLISLFLHAGSEEGDLALTLRYGQEYLKAMLFGLVPYALSQVYASTMRETGETILPMLAGIAAVITNFVLNCLLIFGLFFFPALGVRGAAIATVASRFVELAILVLWGHSHTEKCRFLKGAFKSFHIPKKLAGQIAVKGLPIMVNEFLWAVAVTLRNQCYSTRGLDAVAAQNICSTFFNVFNVVYMALGSSIAIIVGNLLGAGKLEEARDTDRKMVAFSIVCAVVMGTLLTSLSNVFPMFYNVTDSVKSLAAYMITVSALIMPFGAYTHAAYFTLRSGGKVFVTFLFDSVYMWVIVIPIAAALSYLTSVDILLLYLICQGTDVIKTVFGWLLLRKGTWVRQIVSSENS